MRIPTIGYVLAGSAAAALLAGCSGASTGTSSTPQTAGGNGETFQSVGRQLPASASGLAPSMQKLVRIGGGNIRGSVTPALKAPGGATGFISDYNNSVVYVLNQQGAVTATLTGFSSPDGMATDHNGNLYVTNQGTNSVLELAPPYTGTPIATYNDPGQIPIGVAVDDNGDVAVTNIFNTSGGAGNVVFYAAGSTTPTGTATSPTFTSPRFCAFDKKGDLALDDQDIFNTGAVNVGAVLHGNINNQNGHITTLTTANTINFPGGVQITTAGDLAVGDQSSSPPSIYTYHATSTNLGSPISTTPEDGSSDPVNFAFTPGSHLFLTADFGLNAALVYGFPAGGNPVMTVTIPGSSGPIGEAIVPTEQFTVR